MSSQPRPSDPSPTQPVSLDDWPVYTEDSEQVLGLNALIVVLRHIYILGPPSLRESLDARGGSEHAVLRAVRTPSTDADAIARLKEEALGGVASESLLTEAASFLQLIASEDMTKRVWSRPEFLLYSTQCFLWSEEASGWEECHEKCSGEALARKGLVAYDGSTDIGRRVCGLFGSFAPSFRPRYRILPGFPLALRVHYTPAGEHAALAFGDLQSFVLRAASLSPTDGVLRMQEEEYRLCAVVRTRPRYEEPDLVRLYGPDGRYVMPPDGGGDIVEDTWALGQRGSPLRRHSEAKNRAENAGKLKATTPVPDTVPEGGSYTRPSRNLGPLETPEMTLGAPRPPVSAASQTVAGPAQAEPAIDFGPLFEKLPKGDNAKPRSDIQPQKSRQATLGPPRPPVPTTSQTVTGTAQGESLIDFGRLSRRLPPDLEKFEDPLREYKVGEASLLDANPGLPNEPAASSHTGPTDGIATADETQSPQRAMGAQQTPAPSGNTELNPRPSFMSVVLNPGDDDEAGHKPDNDQSQAGDAGAGQEQSGMHPDRLRLIRGELPPRSSREPLPPQDSVFAEQGPKRRKLRRGR
ncbi:hypothetical protein DL770_010700 [Monosporascus sp. CRB-9-2]|nr:hypothetical protein DL770_010700 [Monosporascus sp. CRB-9-2]